MQSNKAAKPRSRAAGKRTQCVPSSGNVFGDLGLPTPDKELSKAKLVRVLAKMIDDRNLPQARVAELLGLDQPKVSALLSGKTGGYSSDRLLQLIQRLGASIEIVIRRPPATQKRRKGRTERPPTGALTVVLK